ncbi:MAG: hypothetical protein CMF51_04340 [Legionellales bacterium]|nr:hypothetical protein [Legionellales bacterium]
MKITRAMIRRIIREQEEEKLPETPAEVEAVEDAWAGGENLELDVDYSKTSTDESNVASPEVLELVVAEVRKRLSEKKDQNKDGKNDFDDVKIARMKASGMSDEEIKKKHPELFEQLTLDDFMVIPDSEPRDFGYGEGEGRMTKSQLDKIARYSQSMHDELLDDDDLPEWVQSKIAVAAENIGKVYHYLDYKMKRMEEEENT